MRPRDIRAGDVREAIRMSELTEYGDIINAVVSVPLFRRAREAGHQGRAHRRRIGRAVRRLLDVPPDRRQRRVAAACSCTRSGNLCRTELQRVDRASMGHGVEARVPFLDLALVELAMRMPIELKIRDGQEKWILREAFAGVLPDYIRARPQEPHVAFLGPA